MNNIEPEKEYGNIEYKSQLVNKSNKRIENIASQMRFRCNQGNGETIYILGVRDSGGVVGLNKKDYEKSLKTLNQAAKINNYHVSLLSKKSIDSQDSSGGPSDSRKKLYIYELLIRENNHSKYIDIKVTVAGQVDSGKSTFISVLTQGKKDNGRGSARLEVFNFCHEVSTGRTSSIGHNILGFDLEGKITNYHGNNFHKKSWPDIVKRSSKIITLYDLCGHIKYLKTTIRGITTNCPDLCLIIVGGNMGLSRTTQEHIMLCVTMKIPFCIVVSKIDICKNRKKVFKETIRQIKSFLKIPGISRIPYKVNNIQDIILSSKNVIEESIVPIFYISNVTGEGIDLIKSFLNLSKKSKLNSSKPQEDKVEMCIDTIFWVHGVGTVVGGQLISGRVRAGDSLFLGPFSSGYRKVNVKSIHCKRIPLQEVIHGKYVCLALKKVDKNIIRRGHVLLGSPDQLVSVNEFDANIKVLKSHSTTIRTNYEPLIHTRSIRQTARLIKIYAKNDARKENNNPDILRTGDKGTVKFKFLYRPEYIKPGYKILMCEGKVKVIGVIKKIIPARSPQA